MAAYRSGSALYDERLGKGYDYTGKQGVTYSEVILPQDAPEWAGARSELWNRLERAERRKDAIICREIQLSLPHELSQEARRKLAITFARYVADTYGLAVDVAIHDPSPEGDEHNHHGHMMVCQRGFDREERSGFARRKSRVFDAIAQKRSGEVPIVESLRAYWCDLVNQALDRAGVAERVDHRSYKRQGIDQEPSLKLGVAATAIERRGIESERGALQRKIARHNTACQKLTEQIAAERQRIRALFRERKAQPPPPTEERPPEQDREQAPSLHSFRASMPRRFLQVNRPGFS